MKEFFRGWKRKVGCVTLVMSCVMMGGWVRGTSYWDQLIIVSGSGSNGGFHSLHSSWQGLTWAKAEHFVDARIYGVHTFRMFRETYRIDQLTLSHVEMDMACEIIDWRWKWGGFDFGKYEDPENITFSFWSVPYWSITIPLTALSAFLLLTKPRQSNQEKINEPIPDKEGATA